MTCSHFSMRAITSSPVLLRSSWLALGSNGGAANTSSSPRLIHHQLLLTDSASSSFYNGHLRIRVNTSHLLRIISHSFSTNIKPSDTSTHHQDTPSPISNRAAFQSTPVIPSILSYIEKIGVGIRPKPTRFRKNKSKQQQRHDSGSVDTLSALEEKKYFTNKDKQHREHWRNQRSESMGKRGSDGEKNRKSAGPLSKHYKRGGKGGTNTVPEEVESKGAYWLPPPPFSSFSKSDATHAKDNDPSTQQQQKQGRKIIRRPVKLLGKAGSLADTLPLESKGLSEIALAGRSNVGKSTLLNALLYGNIDEALSPRKYVRGKTPDGAKLPRGVKAVTSDKPGETKELSFYQLTADIITQQCDGKVGTDAKRDETANSTDNNNSKEVAKMSLLLVDLPGYGFAFAKEERTKEWKELMHHYLLERRCLKRILMLLDARHGFKKIDYDFLADLQEGLAVKNAEGKVRVLECLGAGLMFISRN